jgi:hypothetical protein
MEDCLKGVDNAARIKALENAMTEVKAAVISIWKEIREEILVRPSAGWAKAVSILSALVGILSGSLITIIIFMSKGT